MLHFTEITGLKVRNRMRRGRPAEVTLSDANIPINVSIPAAFRLELEAVHGEILVTESDGNIVFSKANYGNGTVYFLALPLELAMVQQQETSYRPQDLPYWKVYRTVKSTLSSTKIARVENPNIGVTEHSIDRDSRILVLINYFPEEQEAKLLLSEGWGTDTVWYGEGKASESANGIPFKVNGKDAVIMRVARK